MAYKVIILYRLYMPSYFLGTFTEYPFLYETSHSESDFYKNPVLLRQYWSTPLKVLQYFLRSIIVLPKKY